MQNYPGNLEVPVGLGVALARNMEAMNHFAHLSKEEQQEVIERTRLLHSNEEIQELVQTLGSGGF